LLLRTTSEHLLFLPGGNDRQAPLAPESLPARVKAAQESFDFVLIHGGSVLEDDSSLPLLPYVGCVLLLIGENQTRIDDLKAAQEALALCKARRVCIVLTTPFRGIAGFPDQPQVRRQPSLQTLPKLVPE
jgi:hypothetical protein